MAADGAGAGSAPGESTASFAHQAAVEDQDGVYYVSFASGSIMQTTRGGGEPQKIYSNGGTGLLGIRFLACRNGLLYFCDAPSGKIMCVPTSGGDAATVYTSPAPAVQPLPVVVSDERVYFSLLDTASMASEFVSCQTDGSDVQNHFSLPGGFYAQQFDHDAQRVYYAGIDSSSNTRQIRSAALDGSDARVLFSLDGVASADSSVTWQVVDGVLYVCAHDAAGASNRLVRVDPGSGEQEVVRDFASQRVMFDACQTEAYFIDRDTFAVLVAGADVPKAATVATVPKRASETSVWAVEAGEGVVWVTTVTPGADQASEYVTYMVEAASGIVTELV